jgi:hypothetical protein
MTLNQPEKFPSRLKKLAGWLLSLIRSRKKPETPGWLKLLFLNDGKIVIN